MRRSTLSWLRFLAGLTITAACLWLTLRHILFDEVARVAQTLRWPWLALALASLAAGYAARIHRWWWTLQLCNPTVPLRSCAWPLLAGFAVNNVVPFRAGDALRVVGFRRELDMPVAQVLGSLFIERILDLTVLLAFFLVGISGITDKGIPVAYLHAAVLAVGATAVGWLLLLWAGDHLEALLIRICHHEFWHGSSLGIAAEQHVRRLFVALNVVRVRGTLLKLLAMSVVVWSCEGGVFAAVAICLHYEGKALGPWFALSAGSLATMIPSSPGYIGTFDFFTISGFTAYGTREAAAAAMTLTVHIVLWLPITVAGLSYLLLVHLRGRGGRYVADPAQRR